MGSYPGPCTNQGLFSPLLLAATLAPGLMPPNACRGCPHFQIDGTSGVPAACLLPGHGGGLSQGLPAPCRGQQAFLALWRARGEGAFSHSPRRGRATANHKYTTARLGGFAAFRQL